MNRNISVIKDCDNKKIIVINDIIFKGKQINWAEVKRYLKQYVGDFYSIAEDNEIIYIGNKQLINGKGMREWLLHAAMKCSRYMELIEGSPGMKENIQRTSAQG